MRNGGEMKKNKDPVEQEVVENMSGAFRTHVCNNILKQWQRM